MTLRRIYNAIPETARRRPQPALLDGLAQPPITKPTVVAKIEELSGCPDTVGYLTFCMNAHATVYPDRMNSKIEPWLLHSRVERLVREFGEGWAGRLLQRVATGRAIVCFQNDPDFERFVRSNPRPVIKPSTHPFAENLGALGFTRLEIDSFVKSLGRDSKLPVVAQNISFLASVVKECNARALRDALIQNPRMLRDSEKILELALDARLHAGQS